MPPKTVLSSVVVTYGCWPLEIQLVQLKFPVNIENPLKFEDLLLKSEVKSHEDILYLLYIKVTILQIS